MDEPQLSRLRWRCRRGIKELDILLLRFLEQEFPALDKQEQVIFAELLQEADLDIYAWVMGRSSPPNTLYLPIIGQLQPLAEQPFSAQPTATKAVLDELTQPGLARLTDRAVLEVSGPDAGEFLHAQFISDINNMPAGTASLSAWCTPKCRSLCNFIIAFDGEKYTLVLPHDLQQGVMQRLQMFVLRAQLTITDKREQLACLGLLHAGHAALQHSGLPIANKNQCITQEGMLGMAYLTGGSLLVVEADKAEAICADLAATLPVYAAAQWSLLEIQQRCPWLDEATAEAFIPQEMSLDAFGIMSYEKGCYPGQEIIARIHYRGQVKRRLHRATSQAEQHIPAGSKIIARNGKKAGTVITAVKTDKQHHLLGVIDRQYQDEQGLRVDGVENATITLC